MVLFFEDKTVEIFLKTIFNQGNGRGQNETEFTTIKQNTSNILDKGVKDLRLTENVFDMLSRMIYLVLVYPRSKDQFVSFLQGGNLLYGFSSRCV